MGGRGWLEPLLAWYRAAILGPGRHRRFGAVLAGRRRTVLAVVGAAHPDVGWRRPRLPARGRARAPLNLVDRHARHDAGRPDRRLRRTRRRDPGLRRARPGGVLFEQAVAVAPLTLPAHSSIFTGKFPPEHGVRDNGGFFLGPEQVTLAEVLKARGYRTGGFVARLRARLASGASTRASTLLRRLRPQRGARRCRSASIQRPGNEVVDKALPWIEQAKGTPFFAWVHLYDPHTPYRPPEPFASRYAGHPYNGEIAFADSQVGARGRLARRRAGSTTARSSPSWATTARAWATTARAAHGFFIYNSVDARAVRDPRAVQPDRGAPRGRPRAVGGRHADGAGPAGRAVRQRPSPA